VGWHSDLLCGDSMTQDEIIEMARQAHRKLVTEVYVGHMGQLDPWTIELLKIFAKLVAAKEREACAKVCDNKQYVHPYHDLGTLIRARGEA
jgi:hypothetical protein